MRRSPVAFRVAGFSLIELMLAMTILGLGLVLVATMFPVAWSRARDLAEFTSQENITKSAEVLLKQIATVDDPDDTTTITGGTFAGDVIHILDGASNTLFLMEANPRVHALYMENVLVGGAQRRFVPDRTNADVDPEYAPWHQERVDRTNYQMTTLAAPAYFFGSAFGDPQVTFEQRVYPPLPRRDFATVSAAGVFTAPDDDWENALDESRFAWAVLHRLRHDPIDNVQWNDFNAEPGAYERLAGEPRDFDIYYVTLRRPRPSLRYAVQDHSDPTRLPDPFAAAMSVTPRRGDPVKVKSLRAINDVLIPVPWRVQVWFPNDLPTAANATGVPTEIEVNTDNAKTNTPFLVEMFDVGTPFVDEANGKVYRVTRRRIKGDNADQAFITLDQEVVLEDIDDGFFDVGVANKYRNDIIDEEEQLRTVWVFPPDVEPGHDEMPVFSGRQPVVAIDVRPLTVNP